MAVLDLSKYDNLFFDCDGVIWYGNHQIPESIATLRQLQVLGKRIFFITNNSTLTQEELAAKLTRFGYNCEARQVYCTAKATGYLIRRKYPSVKKVYLIGENSYRQELEGMGYTVVHKSDFAVKRVESLDHLKTLNPDPDIEAVVVGNQLSFNYLSAYYGSICVQRGAKLIASNRDPYFILSQGLRMPGCGTIVSFMEHATDKAADVVGKPNPFFMQLAQELDGVDLNRTLMIGDTLDSDVLFARNVGVDSVLVLSGIAKVEDIQGSECKPTYVLPNIAGLITPR